MQNSSSQYGGTTLYSWIDDIIKEAKKEYNQSGYNQVKWVAELELMKATPISMVLEKDQTFAQSKGAKIREEKKVVQNSRLEVIRQYSSSGEYLAEFSSIKNAALHSEISMTSIQKCLVGERKTAGGYIWKREKKESVPKKLDLGKHNTSEKISVENTGLPKRVVQIDVVTGEVIRIHDSVGQAAKSIGINSKGIHDVIKGKQKTAGGYLWQFAD